MSGDRNKGRPDGQGGISRAEDGLAGEGQSKVWVHYRVGAGETLSSRDSDYCCRLYG